MTNNPTQDEPVEGLAEAIMWHIERVCGPLNTENCEVAGDNDRDVLRHNIIATLSPRITRQAEEVARLREALKGAKDALDSIPAPHSFPLWQKMCAAIRKAEAALNEQPGAVRQKGQN